MSALVIHAARDLRIEESSSTEPRSGEVEVAIMLGGICGSDLHYFADGAVGAFRLQEPLILGHEIVGTVARLGPGVDGPAVGTAVVVDPRSPCGSCRYCRSGRGNLCTDNRYLGSAARMPHVQGGFRSRLTVAAERAIPMPAGLEPRRAVFAEPLAVALHGVGQAGDIRGRHVLIAGAGPIGLLCLLGARRAGAERITITDRLAEPLLLADQLGADETILVGAESSLPEADVALDATGSPRALASLLTAVAPGSRVVLVGMLPPASDGLPMDRVVTRELELIGSFRFKDEFVDAIDALADGLDVGPLISARFPVPDALAAFELAVDRRRSSKVQVAFTDDA